MSEQFDIVIIGAGPSGSIASALLNRKGFKVCVIEKQHFPRFVIGESLLPQGMDILEEAGMLDAVEAENFQYKNGIGFTKGELHTEFDFRKQYGIGRESALQVQRDRFDHVLIRQAQKQGVQVRFGETVTNMDNSDLPILLDVKRENGEKYSLRAKFVLDASGYFRAVPRLLGWEMKPDLKQRNVYYTQIDDNIKSPDYDRNKSLIAVHPDYRDVWLWLIPFADGKSSIGLVGEPERFKHRSNHLESAAHILKTFALEIPMFARLLRHAQWDNGFPYLYLPSFAGSVKAVHGKGFALLGNAAEFLDPVFSSGITTAMHSAKLAAECVTRQLGGERVDWQRDYADRQAYGARVFRSCIDNWYNGTLQDWMFDPWQDIETREMFCSVLAGYVWDRGNPYVESIQMNLAM